jgi:hypothetical protein
MQRIEKKPVSYFKERDMVKVAIRANVLRT